MNKLPKRLLSHVVGKNGRSYYYVQRIKDPKVKFMVLVAEVYVISLRAKPRKIPLDKLDSYEIINDVKFNETSDQITLNVV
jgi:hypothetical protein